MVALGATIVWQWPAIYELVVWGGRRYFCRLLAQDITWRDGNIV
jgi:hypothetical protein